MQIRCLCISDCGRGRGNGIALASHLFAAFPPACFVTPSDFVCLADLGLNSTCLLNNTLIVRGCPTVPENSTEHSILNVMFNRAIELSPCLA